MALKVLLVATLLLFTISGAFSDLGLVIETSQGAVLGQFENGYRTWKGIPYGQADRFEFSQYHESWSPEVYPAINYGPSCPQNYELASFQSEDCLFLNIWAPPVENTEKALLPVMVFVHGGAFVQGHGAIALYSGAIFANTSNQVVVSLNYRLGALGFLAGGAELTGNYGFQDQQLALKWIQENIASFGGDPSQMTLFGESAGGASVAYQLISPSAAGLFQRTIVESNPTGIILRTVEENSPYFIVFATKAKCIDGEDHKTLPTKVDAYVNPLLFKTIRECLLNLSIAEILEAQAHTEYTKPAFGKDTSYLLPFTPVIDGDLIPDQPLQLFAKGAFHQLPTIWGTNANESGYMTYKLYPNTSLIPLEYNLLIDVAFGDDSKSVKEHYPASLFKVRDALTNLITDYLFLCPTRYAIRQIAQYVPTYSYVFDLSPQYDPFSNFPACWAKPKGDGLVCHGAELPFVFRTYNIINDPFNQEEVQLSIIIQGLWSSFSNQTINQNPTLPFWPIYNTTTDELLRLKSPSDIVSGWRASYCDFWDTLNIYN